MLPPEGFTPGSVLLSVEEVPRSAIARISCLTRLVFMDTPAEVLGMTDVHSTCGLALDDVDVVWHHGSEETGSAGRIRTSDQSVNPPEAEPLYH